MTTQRSQFYQRLKDEKFDLIIIGGGATGAGIALDAASRGLKTALVEKQDFASGTSSKSTKLIHGGLRYLKQFEFGLVREVGRERAIVHQLAPHLVKPEKMLLPIVQGGTYGKLASSFGLWVYDLLAGVKGDDRRRMLSQRETLQEEPLLRKEDLKGGGLYAEYRTDDARLTIENVKTAARLGAVCMNYLKVTELLYQKEKVAGCRCIDQLTGEQLEIKAHCIVNAAGPWVDDLRRADQSLKGKRIFLSKGIHVVVPSERLPLRHSVYFDVPGGRMLFAIPRQRATYIGTTDTAFKGDTNHVFAERKEVEYVLNSANSMFPESRLTFEDVESTWAGLRPLIYEEGKSAGEMSRKDEIFISPTGLISIAGGKLTGYRKMAEKIVNLVAKKLEIINGVKYKPCHSDKIPLSSEPFNNITEVIRFQQSIAEKITKLSLPGFYTIYLVENYGRDAASIADTALSSGEKGEAGLIKSELDFTVRNELVVKLADFFERRTGRLYFNIQSVRDNLDVVLDGFRHHLHWDNERCSQEKKEMDTLINISSRF
jgi:glycerol-3-phosphate dehydrogenase